jgi:hypothetical protein
MSKRSYWSSTIEVTDNVLARSSEVVGKTLSDPARTDRLNELGQLASALEAFVRGYERIDDPALNTDDEILNWTFGETPTDLAGAIWLLASGYYKASASCLRNAFEIAVASLYFQIRENENTTAGYNKFFSEWDRGERRTPNWGEMKPHITRQATVASFSARAGIDPVAMAYEHFQYLCAYTHTSAFAGADDPVTAINMTGVAPEFDEACFARGCKLVATTICMVALLWQIVFPGIARTEPLGPLSSGAYDKLFALPHGAAALTV